MQLREEKEQEPKVGSHKSKNPDPEAVPFTQAVTELSYKKAAQAVATKLAVTMEGVKAFELYGYFLSNEVRQSWELRRCLQNHSH